VQSIDTNYLVIGKDAFDQNVLDILGVTGFKAGGLGANIYHDSRDDENSPTRGWMLNINNIAYREWLGGDDQFDVYRMDFRGFYPHGSGNVFGVRQNNQWTADAPTAAYASIHLRGYKAGQYLGKYMSSIEAEERWRFAQHWTATLFAGVACLYGNDNDCGDDESIYPNWGAGVQYILRPKERMVINAEYAGGKDGNYGVYVKFGYGF
jgi:outer membrane protein assembly factor BamA